MLPLSRSHFQTYPHTLYLFPLPASVSNCIEKLECAKEIHTKKNVFCYSSQKSPFSLLFCFQIFKLFQISRRSRGHRQTFLAVPGTLVSSVFSATALLLVREDLVASPWLELRVVLSSGGAYGRISLELGFWFVGGAL